MIVWIASSGRSGNTFFRVVIHGLYGINTYAAFQAAEILLLAGAEALVGHKELPECIQLAIAAGTPEQIRQALEELNASNELFVFKTHAMAHELLAPTIVPSLSSAMVATRWHPMQIIWSIFTSIQQPSPTDYAGSHIQNPSC